MKIDNIIDNNIVVRIETEEDLISCLEMLYTRGFTWYSGIPLIDYTPKADYPIYIEASTGTVSWTDDLVFDYDVVYFNDIEKEENTQFDMSTMLDILEE